jgi:hypothetical protein
MPDTTTRVFDIADILTITTKRLLGHRHMDGLYEILSYMSYMTGDPIFTHQLPTAADACRPALFEQHPQLGEIEVPEDVDVPELEAWLAGVERRYGMTLPVAPLAEWRHLGLLDGLPERLKRARVVVL